MPAVPKEKKIMNNTDVVSSECSYKPRDLDEPLPLPIEPLFGRGPDRPTSPCGVNGQLIDTVRLNGVYEMAPPYTCREAWLAAGAAQIAPDFRAAGYRIPEKMRFSIGFPSTGRHGATLGECWSDTHSRDQTHEIFIRADQDEPVDRNQHLRRT
jgi:hypothetical protein